MTGGRRKREERGEWRRKRREGKGIGREESHAENE